MIHELNQVDLAFVVDTTSSMGPFIDTARRHMVATIRALIGGQTSIDLRLAVVEYRDHPPQDPSFAARANPFESNMTKVQKTIDALSPSGGGDGPESVFDGLIAAAELAWRPHSRRLAVLVGDAPPHGCGTAGDGFPNGCPCGETIETVSAKFEQHGILLAALGLTPYVQASFGKLARYTGGEYFDSGQGDRAIEAIQKVLTGEFADLEFDRKVLDRTRQERDWSIDALGTALESPRGRISASLSRLGRRGLLVI